MSQNGKGDRNRSDPKKYAEGYDRIFNHLHRAKLREEDVLDIRDAFANGMTQAELSRLYGVSRSTVNSIVRRKSWKLL